MCYTLHIHQKLCSFIPATATLELPPPSTGRVRPLSQPLRSVLVWHANRQGLITSKSPASRPARAPRPSRLASTSERRVCSSSYTRATEAPLLFEVQRRKKPLKVIAFMLTASKRRDGQAVIVCSGLELRARHQ